MARLTEHQGKELLAACGLRVPRGRVVRSADAAGLVTAELGGRSVLKIQACATGRESIGGVAFAEDPDEAKRQASRLLRMRVEDGPVEGVLVEEHLVIRHELLVSLVLDDRTRRPVLLFSEGGGGGIEARTASALRIECDVRDGPEGAGVFDVLERSMLSPTAKGEVRRVLSSLFEIARTNDALEIEINPLVVTPADRVVCADCRITLDDDALFRLPYASGRLVREAPRTPAFPTRRDEEIARDDPRGAVCFVDLNAQAGQESRGLVGLIGQGGGATLVAMDAIEAGGFTPANYCDVAGGAPAAVLWRAACAVFAREGLVGCLGCGPGVSGQEQYWIACGLAKALWEINPTVPTVVRFGGAGEARAVRLLEAACAGTAAPVEGYPGDEEEGALVRRLGKLIEATGSGAWRPARRRVPDFVGSARCHPIRGGLLWIDEGACRDGATSLIVERSMGVLVEAGGVPVPALPEGDFLARGSELIACEVECRAAGSPAVFVDLDPEGIE